jgi:uncharacterized protein (TIGR00255 family)
MQSMTGFGQGSASDANATLTVQIAAVNHRGLQIQVRSDLRDLAADEQVKSEVRKALDRGAVTVQVRVVAASTLSVDRTKLAATWRELAALAQELGAPAPALERVASLVPAQGGDATPGADLLPKALSAAIAAIQAERRREGAALTAAFRTHATALRALAGRMQVAAAARTAAWREHLTTRLREILAGTPVPDEVLVRELALYSERVDVTEEQVRLAAHCDALDALLAEPDGIDGGHGRRLEFLLQEIGREVNTTGSKSNDTALTTLVLEAKAIVEQMKEQAANVL